MLKLTAIVLAAALTSTAHAAGWRSLRIDASSEASFSTSVAVFQEKLPRVQRYVFERALQDVWALGAERAETEQREYTAEDYLGQLDGLGYKDVVTLMDPSGDTALARYRAAWASLQRRAPPRIAASPGPERPAPIGWSGEQVRGIDNQRQAIQERLANEGRL